ncbi:MAG: 4Fe-4S binding protein, partial [Eubacteriales bacterium]|nr:4Fe-4S binding protein [Eubacteriales bacterium]
EDIVRMNHEAIDKGFTAMSKVDVPAAWADATDTPKKPLFEVKDPELKKFMDNVLVPTNDQHGDDIPVSVFSDYVEGKQPLGSSALEKRGVSLFVPEWQPDKCIQCNQCAYVCPHAVIRPVAMTETEA